MTYNLFTEERNIDNLVKLSSNRELNDKENSLLYHSNMIVYICKLMKREEIDSFEIQMKDILKWIMSYKKINQKQLSGVLGLTQNKMSNIMLNKEKELSLYIVKKVYELFNIDADLLLNIKR